MCLLSQVAAACLTQRSQSSSTSSSISVGLYYYENGVARLVDVIPSPSGINGPSVEQSDASFGGASAPSQSESASEPQPEVLAAPEISRCWSGGSPTPLPAVTVTARRPTFLPRMLFARIPDNFYFSGSRGRNVAVRYTNRTEMQFTCGTELILRAREARALAIRNAGPIANRQGAIYELELADGHMDTFVNNNSTSSVPVIQITSCPGQ